MVAPAATLAAGLRQVNPGAAEAFDAFGFLQLPGADTYGNDERIDVESLRLTTRLWLDVVTDFHR